MEFKKFNNKYVLRLDPNEEIIETIKCFCLENNITLGTINGIGAVNEITVGLFNPKTKEYNSETFKDDFEIVSLLGNISTMNDDCYLHLHICVTDSNYKAIGGHLNKAVISATGEIIIESIEGNINRKFSDEIGLNLYDF